MNLLFKYQFVFIPGLIFLVYLIKCYFTLDPDFGWHYRMGELILSSGVPFRDPFSYTMPSFSFISHEWLTDVKIHIIYNRIGWLGLSAVFSLLVILALAIPLRFKFSFYSILPILLCAFSLLIFIGIRPQIISMLFFSILITLLLEKKLFEKFKYFLPILFLFWANLHAGFAMGLSVFFVFLLLSLIEKRKFVIQDWGVIVVSLLATFINPYGLRIWEEIWRSISDSALRWAISEWMPSFFTFYPVLYLYIAFSASLVFKFRKSFSLFEKTLFVLLLLAGFSSIRHMTFWAIFALPVTFKGILIFEKQASKIKYGGERFKKAYLFFIFLTIIFILVSFVNKSSTRIFLTEEKSYPAKAVNYLKQNPHKGQLLSVYNWGGYLIWKYPEKKVFIDGRMPSWRRDSAPENESLHAFREYADLASNDTNFERAVGKYSIDLVLLPMYEEGRENFITKMDKMIQARFFKKSKSDNIYSILGKKGWEIVYKDEISVIYKKPD